MIKSKIIKGIILIICFILIFGIVAGSQVSDGFGNPSAGCNVDGLNVDVGDLDENDICIITLSGTVPSNTYNVGSLSESEIKSLLNTSITSINDCSENDIWSIVVLNLIPPVNENSSDGGTKYQFRILPSELDVSIDPTSDLVPGDDFDVSRDTNQSGNSIEIVNTKDNVEKMALLLKVGEDLTFEISGENSNNFHRIIEIKNQLNYSVNASNINQFRSAIISPQVSDITFNLQNYDDNLCITDGSPMEISNDLLITGGSDEFILAISSPLIVKSGKSLTFNSEDGCSPILKISGGGSIYLENQAKLVLNGWVIDLSNSSGFPITGSDGIIVIGENVSGKSAYSLIKNLISTGYSGLIKVDTDIITNDVYIPKNTKIVNNMGLHITIPKQEKLLIGDSSFILGDESIISGDKTSKFTFGGQIASNSQIYSHVLTEFKDTVSIGNNVSIYADYSVFGGDGADIFYPVYFEDTDSISVSYFKDGKLIDTPLYLLKGTEYEANRSEIKFSDGISVNASAGSDYDIDYWNVYNIGNSKAATISSKGIIANPIIISAVFKKHVNEASSETEFKNSDANIDNSEIPDDEILNGESKSVGNNVNYDNENSTLDISSETSVSSIENLEIENEGLPVIQTTDDNLIAPSSKVISCTISENTVDVGFLSSNGMDVIINVLADGNISGLSFSKDGSDENSSTLAGVMPDENNGTYSLRFLPGNYEGMLGDWNIYVVFETGEKELIGSLRLLQSEVSDTSNDVIISESQDYEVDNVEKSIPESPGFGIISCLLTISMIVLFVYRKK